MQKTVAVIGGGIGGLSACYHLTKSSQVFKIVLLESSSRLGGWLRSTRREDGAIFEHGPRGIRPAGNVGKNTLKMVSELGLENEILPVTSDNIASKNRFLYVGGKLHKMPSGAAGALRKVPPFSRALVSSVVRELLVKRGTQEDDSVHGFVERRLGKEDGAQGGSVTCSGSHTVSQWLSWDLNQGPQDLFFNHWTTKPPAVAKLMLKVLPRPLLEISANTSICDNASADLQYWTSDKTLLLFQCDAKLEESGEE